MGRNELAVLQRFAGVGDDFDEAVAVAPFVVIPGDDFDEVATDNVCQRKVNDTRVAIALEVARNKFFFGHIEDTLIERLLGCFLEDILELFNGRIFL